MRLLFSKGRLTSYTINTKFRTELIKVLIPISFKLIQNKEEKIIIKKKNIKLLTVDLC